MISTRYFFTLLLAVVSCPSLAIDIGITDAIAPRVGLSAVQYGYTSSHRGKFYLNGEPYPLATELNTTRQYLRLSRTFDWGGRPSIFYVQLPYLNIETENVALSPKLRAVDAGAGVGDLALLLATWLHSDRDNGRYLTVGGYLFVPTGEYNINNTKVVNTNPGGNRLRAALQVAHHLQLSEKLGWMMAFDTLWSASNPETYLFSPTPVVQRQAPLHSFQTALSYRLNPQLNVGATYFYSVGGENSLGGVAQRDTTRTQRYEVSSNYFILPSVRLTLQYGADVKIENGFKEMQRFSFSITQIF